MRMSNGCGKRIGCIGTLDPRRGQETLHHGHDLPLARVTDADDAFLDVVRGIFSNLEAGMGGGQQRHSAGLAELQGSGRIFVYESLFDGDRVWTLLGHDTRKRRVQGKQPRAQAQLRIACQNTMSDMDKPRAIQHDKPPSHPGQARIKA
jgi:hypothetical protein